MTLRRFHCRKSQIGKARLQIERFTFTGSLPEETGSSRGANNSVEKFSGWVRDRRQVLFYEEIKRKIWRRTVRPRWRLQR